MRPSTASALATLVSTASAVAPRPFLLLSTHKSSTPLSAPQYAAQSLVLDAVETYLADCPTQQYLIVNQADLHSTDIYDPDTIPNLRRHVHNGRWADRLEIGEVHDKTIDGEALAMHIRTSCPDSVVETQYLRSLGTGESRSVALADNDVTLSESISNLASKESLTLIYFGGAVDSDLEAATNKQQYVAAFTDDGAHIELKRQLGALGPRAAENEDEPELPDTSDWTWFQKNSWLSQAQTVIIATIIFFALLLFFAMQQVTGIDIPYGSFDAGFVSAATAVEKKKSH